MIEPFVKSLFESIVEENIELYKNLFETTNISSKTNEYWRQAITLYTSVDEKNKDVLMKIIKQTMVDTISNLLGVIDGTSTLKNCPIAPKLFLDSIDTEGELQEHFLAFIEENYSNN